MIFLIYKYAYGKILSNIQNKIKKIEESIISVEFKKDQAENELMKLEKSIVEISEKKEDAIKRAQERAEKIIFSSNKSVQQIAKQKELEYNQATKKIKTNIASEIKKRIISLSVGEFMRRINAKKNKREMHNVAIEKSIDMLEAKSRENSAF